MLCMTSPMMGRHEVVCPMHSFGPFVDVVICFC